MVVTVDTLNVTSNSSLDDDDERQEGDCTVFANFVINSLLAGFVCIFGFAGNTISFVVLAKDRKSPVASFLLQALALSDNLFLCAWFLQFSVVGLFEYVGMTGDFGVSWLYVRLYTYPLVFLGQTATIWMTVLIAISRYVAVCKPYAAPKFCSLQPMKKGVLLVVVFSILYNLPRYFETTVDYRLTRASENDTNITAVVKTLIRTQLGGSRLYRIIYFDVLYYIFCFVLPLLMLLFLNTKLILAYRVVRHKRNSMTRSRPAQQHPDRNITLVMIIVILVFILCNAPARIVQVYYGYRVLPCPTVEFLLSTFSTVLEVVNSSTNFLIYCIFRQHFRKILCSYLCDSRRRQRDRDLSLTERPFNTTTTAQTSLRHTSLRRFKSSMRHMSVSVYEDEKQNGDV